MELSTLESTGDPCGANPVKHGSAADQRSEEAEEGWREICTPGSGSWFGGQGLGGCSSTTVQRGGIVREVCPAPALAATASPKFTHPPLPSVTLSCTTTIVNTRAIEGGEAAEGTGLAL